MSKAKPALLITSNYSSDTGFAWNFFYRIFSAIGHDLSRQDIPLVLSFAEVVNPVTVLDEELAFDVFTFDPFHITLASLRELRKNIRRHNIRFGYFTDFPSWHWLYLLMRFWGLRRIVVHDSMSVPAPYPEPPEKGLKKFLKNALHRVPLLTPDKVIACSDYVQGRLLGRSCMPAKKIVVIRHGIELIPFQSKLPPSNAQLRIFCVARATSFKGINILIEACNILVNEKGLTGFCVRYGGSGPELEDFKYRVAEYQLGDAFEFLGPLSHTASETIAADIIVVPSCWGDAYPLTVMEGMAAGKPVIATDVGGIPEQIQHEQDGLLVPPANAVVLAEAMERLIKDEVFRLRLGLNAGQRAAQSFGEEGFHQTVVAELNATLKAGK